MIENEKSENGALTIKLANSSKSCKTLVNDLNSAK